MRNVKPMEPSRLKLPQKWDKDDVIGTIHACADKNCHNYTIYLDNLHPRVRKVLEKYLKENNNVRK